MRPCSILFIITVYFATVHGVLYHRFSGDKLDDTEIEYYTSNNLTETCTIDVKPCDAAEGRRVDGTCNNLHRPTRGAAVGPYSRLLSPDYANNKGIRVSTSGEPLTSARRVRTQLLKTGRVVSKSFNMAALHLAGFIAIDISFVNGLQDYILERPYCCEPEGQADPRCIPITVPDDDPYLSHTDIRCLNLSRAQTFQDSGCLPTTLPPEQINFQTPLLDLSSVYGENDERLAAIREGEKGLLKLESRNNRIVPIEDICFKGLPVETMCYKFGDPLIGNFDLRLTTFTVFFMREHNRIAQALAEVNPCWDDEKLFEVARQINIATISNIFMYELLPLFLGYQNMLDNYLITDETKFITEYDPNAELVLYAEFVIGMRYFHTLIDGRIKNYDNHYKETSEFSISKTLLNIALIEQNNTFEEMNRGTFCQKASAMDNIGDPEITETFFAPFHKAGDLPAIDIQRGRDFGLPGYNAYRPLCGLKRAESFDDFLDSMEVSQVEALKKLYATVDDVDFIAGIISENHIEGGFVGPTLFCVIVKQLQLARFGDRFWFERGDQSTSFNLEQLKEIRNTTIARFACDNAEAIDSIQRQAFLNVGSGNERVPCSELKGIDFSKWRDSSCC